MKITQIVQALIIGLVFVTSTQARAGGHWPCQDEPHGCGFNNQSLIEERVLGRRFCYTEKLNTGWGFTKEGEAYFFAPNIGMPNPDVYYRVKFLRSTDQFEIDEYSRYKALPTRTLGRFFYDSKNDLLNSGNGILSPLACSF